MMDTVQNSPFAVRLKQARTMSGMSLRELADRLGGAVSHAALNKYEHGRMLPSSSVLIALADALQQSPDFFFRPLKLQLKGVRFRKRSRLGASVEKAVIEKVRDHFQRYQEVEELLGEARPFQAPFPNQCVRTAEEAELLANKLRVRWNLGLDPLPNVQELLEDHGIKVFELQIENRDFDGLKAESEAGPLVVLASWLRGNLPRMRLTEVHELAHVVLPIAEDIEESEEEKLVNRFAGAFLLPAASFRASFGGHRHQIGVGELIELKSSFGASIMAIMERAEQLELITDSLYKRFCIYANQNRWRIQGEPGDEDYNRSEKSGRFRRLVLRAVAEGHLSMSSGAEHLGVQLVELRRELKTVIV